MLHGRVNGMSIDPSAINWVLARSCPLMISCCLQEFPPFKRRLYHIPDAICIYSRNQKVHNDQVRAG